MAPQDQDKKCNYRSSGNNMKERGVASRAQITKYRDFLFFDNRTATKFSQRHVEGFEAKTMQKISEPWRGRWIIITFKFQWSLGSF